VHAAQSLTPPHTVPAPPPAPGMGGTILAMRPVPIAAIQPVSLLLSSSGRAISAPAHNLYEFIVRTADGTTIAVIQPATADLRPGEQVRIASGPPPRIDMPATR